MRRTTTPALLLAGVLLFGAASCGNDDDNASDTTVAALDTTDTAVSTAPAAADTTAVAADTTAVAGDASDTTAVAGLPSDGSSGGTGAGGGTVAVTATEPSAGKYAFDGMPASLPAGLTHLRLTNSGGEPHELALVRVDGNHTVDEFVDKVVNGEGQPIPDWVLGHTGVGTTPPTQATDATVVLQPGTYLFYCSISDKNDVPHAKNGMSGTLKVEGDEAAAATAASQLPATDASVTIRDYAFDINGLKAGTNTVTIENTGQQFHHIVLFPYAGSATLADVKKFLSAGPGAAAGSSAPPAAPPVDFEKEVSSAVVGPGESLVTTMDLAAGRWVALCFVTDKAGSAPHAMSHDMVQDVTIP